MSKSNAVTARKYYLDWIHVLVIYILIPLHVSVSFSPIRKGYVYTVSPADSFLYVFISVVYNRTGLRLYIGLNPLWFYKLVCIFLSAVFYLFAEISFLESYAVLCLSL